MEEVDQYLWQVYLRKPVKTDSSGDFTWKDPAAAKHLGVSLQSYVIGGMAKGAAMLAPALATMLEAARSGANMIPSMLDAARAEATLGEICDTLRQEWGSYAEAPAF